MSGCVVVVATSILHGNFFSNNIWKLAPLKIDRVVINKQKIARDKFFFLTTALYRSTFTWDFFVGLFGVIILYIFVYFFIFYVMKSILIYFKTTYENSIAHIHIYRFFWKLSNSISDYYLDSPDLQKFCLFCDKHKIITILGMFALWFFVGIDCSWCLKFKFIAACIWMIILIIINISLIAGCIILLIAIYDIISDWWD